MEACHFPDSDPANCAIANLRWDTPKANQADMRVHGTDPSGSRNGQAKLTEIEVALMRRDVANGMSQSAAAAKFGVCPSLVSLVVNRKRWTRV